jgi:8-amino-7-oxononanoate synthase
MTRLLDKYQTIIERRARMLAVGSTPSGWSTSGCCRLPAPVINGRETILAGTNNYMGITFEPDCIAAGQAALANFGTGTTGSRIANGTYAIHTELEAALAEFLGRKHCIVFTTGYQANLAMISGLAGPRDTIFLDADSHSSIYDGCTLSGARLVRFRHNDAADLGKRLARMDPDDGGKLVVLEGIYSMLGDRPPLADFVELKRQYGFELLVDEAHSFGVLGPNGRGLADEAGLEEECDYVVGTFSKSIGSIGGFGAGNDEMFDVLRYAARPYMFTASPSPASIATARAALARLAAEPERRTRLWENSKRLHDGFRDLGLDLGCDTVSPIVAVKCPDEPSTVAMWNALLDAGVYVNIAVPPGTPNRLCLLRCSVSAAHTTDEIDLILELFGKVVAAHRTRASA